MAVLGFMSTVGAMETVEPCAPPSPRCSAPRLPKDIVVMVVGSSVSVRRYGCREIPAWTGGYDRMPPQSDGQNVFFRVFEMLNDHENMCWRRLTDSDWTRHGPWLPEHHLPYIESSHNRISYIANDPNDYAELSVPAGYEKVDLIYTSDPHGDKIRVTIDGKEPLENSCVDTYQEMELHAPSQMASKIETLDSHGNPRTLSPTTKGISNIVELRAHYKIDPNRSHVFKARRATDDPNKRILIWGAVYWRGNCIQVVQRAKGGINCGDLPNLPAIQETVALNPDYVLMEAINIRAQPDQIARTLEPGFSWCAQQAGKFKTLVYATPMANCKAFRSYFNEKVTDENAAACAESVVKLCDKYKFPMIDIGPAVDRWLTLHPNKSFVEDIYADWYHPNQWGAVIFGQSLFSAIEKFWPELPIRHPSDF